MEGLEKERGSRNLCDKAEEESLKYKKEEISRPDTPASDASDDSFHSLEDEDRGVQNHQLEPSTSEEIDGSSEECDSSNILVIEPDGKDGTESHEYLPAIDKMSESSWGKQEEQEHVDDDEEEDFVDEEYLKDLELNMSDEEKQAKKEESQNHKENGNISFKAGLFQEAVISYTAGLRICPLSYPKDRAILYSNRAAANAKLDKKKKAISDCSKAIDLDGVYTKAILRRANLNEETENLDEALKDFQRVLELDPASKESHEAVRRLPDMINERNEKLKEEMIGKLKDLGNMFLRPFGLSTRNFELKQDPGSGGYNISFKQNPNS
ncbi:hypothetical protein OTU49_011576 [Cherax quadricarinatus]|uniref:Tetratricopeptide repeat protein 1 n=1 Tax=Cherax quadricarinatus TaxID=27406 RepID=A0AAW0W4J0_CHEQU|nr:tetratricopeptide repeat protein 1-like [Cherax quadricarinatus]XP_053646715.1 tetratricopeptide repeat protein 1-like [Cherax quadricarinatus]XP_053646716.1 tetratricopeptide repeat protein 1-like [Cherax quadricarinatus]XP_053646717.1 tetratricopeptide repeat protein 1-like [Cherax quadricarinatus]